MVADLNNLPLNEWAVPTSPANVLMRLCMSIFQVGSLSASVTSLRQPAAPFEDWYCEFLHKSLVVNPPTIVNVLWQIGKAFISENTLSKIIIAGKLDEIKKHMDVSPISHPTDCW